MNIKTKLYLLALSLFGGVLGVLTGVGYGAFWRKIGIPALLAVLAYCIYLNLSLLTIFAMAIPLSFGYGIPTPLGLIDEGSPIGRFWYRFFKRDEKKAGIATMSTIAWLCSLTLLSVPLMRNNWLCYVTCSAIVILDFGLLNYIGARLKSITIKGREYSVEEFLRFVSLTLFSLIIILF